MRALTNKKVEWVSSAHPVSVCVYASAAFGKNENMRAFTVIADEIQETMKSISADELAINNPFPFFRTKLKEKVASVAYQQLFEHLDIIFLLEIS